MSNNHTFFHRISIYAQIDLLSNKWNYCIMQTWESLLGFLFILLIRASAQNTTENRLRPELHFSSAAHVSTPSFRAPAHEKVYILLKAEQSHWDILTLTTHLHVQLNSENAHLLPWRQASVKEAMPGLLEIAPEKRWTLDELQNHECLKSKPENPEWTKPAAWKEKHKSQIYLGKCEI